MSVLAIDLGTGSVKAASVADDLTVRRAASRPYPVLAPGPGAAEGDPGQWRAAVAGAVAEVLDADQLPPPRAVGLSGQMHGLVLLDRGGRELGPAVLWPDTRAVAEVARLAALPAADRARLANPLVPGMAGPLLAFLATTDPGRVAAARAAVQPKDWLRVALAGPAALAADPSDASATLLWDVPGDGWSAPAAAALGVDVALLPPVRASSAVVGTTTGALGLPAGLPVVTGAADTACAALGTGTLRPGRGQISIGTGGQILVPVAAATVRATADPEPVVHTYRDAADGWYRMGAIQNCGLALERVLAWFGITWPQALATLGHGPVGGGVDQAGKALASGPVFLPHLTGERTPWLDARMRGAWVGLGLGHERDDLVRAALLGVICAIADAWDAVRAGADPGVPLLVGGGSVDAAWRQLLADVLDSPVLPAPAPHAGVLGAAALALVGAGDLTMDDAVTALDARACAGAEPVEPAGDARGWAAALRGRFADARRRLAAGHDGRHDG